MHAGTQTCTYVSAIALLFFFFGSDLFFQKEKKGEGGGAPCQHTRVHAHTDTSSCRMGVILGRLTLQSAAAFPFFQQQHHHGYHKGSDLSVARSQQTCHYEVSVECAHVSIHEVACYRTEMTLMGCTPISDLELTKKQSGHVVNVTYLSCSPSLQPRMSATQSLPPPHLRTRLMFESWFKQASAYAVVCNVQGSTNGMGWEYIKIGN